MSTIAKWAFFGLTVAILSGCSHGESMSSIRQFVANGPKINHDIPPLPKIKKYRPVAYQNMTHADPFTSFSEILLRDEAAKESSSGPVPSYGTASSPLQRYALSSLRLTGVVRGVNGHLWAVLQTPKNDVYRAKIGWGVGVHKGHITSIADTAGKQCITVEQYIPNAFGGYKPEKTVVYLNTVH